ncbi:DUF1648 domain-containing protein [Pirellulaceae bacterium SH449]
MLTTRALGWCFLATLVVVNMIGLTLHWHYYEQLPEQVATHFDAKGQPGNFKPKEQATMLLAGLEIGLSWFMVLMGMVISLFPSGLINIPNRNYWLAGARRGESLAYTRMIMNGIALATALFVMMISYSTFVANRDQAPLDGVLFWSGFSLYMLAMLAIVVLMQVRFRLPR